MLRAIAQLWTEVTDSTPGLPDNVFFLLHDNEILFFADLGTQLSSPRNPSGHSSSQTLSAVLLRECT